MGRILILVKLGLVSSLYISTGRTVTPHTVAQYILNRERKPEDCMKEMGDSYMTDLSHSSSSVAQWSLDRRQVSCKLQHM